MRSVASGVLLGFAATLSAQVTAMADEARDAMALRKDIRGNDLAAVRQLLDRGVDPNADGWKEGESKDKLETSLAFEETRLCLTIPYWNSQALFKAR